MLLLEIYRLNKYYQKGFKLSYFATKNNVEIDLVLTKNRTHYLIEIKSSDLVDEREVTSLERIAKDFPNIKKVFYLSNQKQGMKIGLVDCLNWTAFLRDFEKL